MKTKRHIDAMERITLRENSKVKYFFKYTLKEYYARFFRKDFPEDLLCTTFDMFYKNWTGNNDEPKLSWYKTEEEFEDACDLHNEIKTLLDYWAFRGLNPRDRIQDDQMFIRLVKIRHKLRFDEV